MDLREEMDKSITFRTLKGSIVPLEHPDILNNSEYNNKI